MVVRATPYLFALMLLPAPAPLLAQAGNLNFLTGVRFDGGHSYPGVGTELQLGPRPWLVKGTLEFHAGFPPANGPDIEGSLGAVWIWDRPDASFLPYLGAGGSVIGRHFSWKTIFNAAPFVRGGVLMRRGTNGNWGLDVRFLTGPMRDRLDGVLERVRYLQIAVLIGWGW